MRHHQKIAIARLISDLIKSDDVICREEIQFYNQIVRMFAISQDELHESQFISLSEAVDYIKHMPTDEQEKIYTILSKAIYSNHSCVAREALLLITLSVLIHDKENKYSLMSSIIKNGQYTEKYVIYIESDYMHAINEEIQKNYETISNLLHLWNFEFIYIPKLTQSFRELERDYLCDIIFYMNPRLSQETLDKLYEKLIHYTTESYTRDYIASYFQQTMFYDIEPSLLINVGYSPIPSMTQVQQDSYYTNFLIIRLDNEENSVLHEVRRFLDQYESLITEPEYHRPKRNKKQFHYHGFYKQLFDFLVRHHTNGEENSIMIDLSSRRVWMQGIEVQMSATHLATYVFILHQTFCTHYGGLIKAGQHHPLSEKDIDRLGSTYRAICQLFRDTKSVDERCYLNNVPNIRGYIARIRMAINHHIGQQDVNYYIPLDSSDKSRYHVAIDPTKIKIRDLTGEYSFVEYPYWKSIK